MWRLLCLRFRLQLRTVSSQVSRAAVTNRRKASHTTRPSRIREWLRRCRGPHPDTATMLPRLTARRLTREAALPTAETHAPTVLPLHRMDRVAVRIVLPPRPITRAEPIALRPHTVREPALQPPRIT